MNVKCVNQLSRILSLKQKAKSYWFRRENKLRSAGTFSSIAHRELLALKYKPLLASNSNCMPTKSKHKTKRKNDRSNFLVKTKYVKIKGKTIYKKSRKGRDYFSFEILTDVFEKEPKRNKQNPEKCLDEHNWLEFIIGRNHCLEKHLINQWVFMLFSVFEANELSRRASASVCVCIYSVVPVWGNVKKNCRDWSSVFVSWLQLNLDKDKYIYSFNLNIYPGQNYVYISRGNHRVSSSISLFVFTFCALFMLIEIRFQQEV